MDRKELIMLQALPLELKIEKTKLRIREFIDYVGINGCYISFSGGKDSTVLMHIVKQTVTELFGGGTSVPVVFCDTGLEYPEIKQFVKKLPEITIIRPEMNFKQVIKKYGYPVISKESSNRIYKLNNYNLSEKYRNKILHGDERGSFGKLADKWHYLLNADFNISDKCCDIMKKKPFHKYEKETKRCAITGEMACESRSREKLYLQYGCNAFERKTGPKSTPLGFWTEQDILEYLKVNNIPIAECYGDIITYKTINGKEYYTTTKEKRTGCMFCAYGIHLEKDINRFQRMKIKHPQIYKYCIDGGAYDKNGKWIPSNDGLGLGHVLDEINIKY